MVQLADKIPVDARGIHDLEGWSQHLTAFTESEGRLIRDAVDLLIGTSTLVDGGQMANLLLDLLMDSETIVAGLLLFGVRTQEIGIEAIPSDEARKLIEALQKLTSADYASVKNAPILNIHAGDQLANVRHMLIALIDDPRVAVLKLVERVVVLRRAKSMPAEERERIAREVLDFYSPFASRLGIRQLKWVLEDLAFNYLRPREYRQIAEKLGTRRNDRESQISAVCDELEWRLDRASINARVTGRAKHIYGIWRKMQEKKISFGEVRDIEAVRVIVDSIPDCYSVLGIVHTSWPHIANEFDDYIANPKDNGYRSIHTAVIGPRGRTLEVQIRTHEMHNEAELGVCSHWAYKGDDDDALRSGKADWLRQVYEWHEELHRGEDPLDFKQQDESLERVYVATPQGHVVDLVSGATAVDFAFRIHTDIGIHCVGAVADGEEIPLNAPLKTGQIVEIRTDETSEPDRTWLDGRMGYVRTTRARDKIQSWFRGQLAESNISAGKSLLIDTFHRHRIPLDIDVLMQMTNYRSEVKIFHAIGVGELMVIDLVHLAQARRARDELSLKLDNGSRKELSIKRIEIRSVDRRGILNEMIYAIVAEGINVVLTEARVIEHDVLTLISIEVQVKDLGQLTDVIEQLRAIPGVFNVQRMSTH